MESLLLNFDLDCCAVAFRVGGSSVLATERCLRALRYGVNVFDTDFYSKSYCRRLEKYAGLIDLPPNQDANLGGKVRFSKS